MKSRTFAKLALMVLLGITTGITLVGCTDSSPANKPLTSEQIDRIAEIEMRLIEIQLEIDTMSNDLSANGYPPDMLETYTQYRGVLTAEKEQLEAELARIRG